MQHRKPVLLIALNAFVVLVFLVICLTPFIAGSDLSWLVSMAGMGFPIFAAVLLLFLIIWIFRLRHAISKLMIIVNVVVLLIGIQQIRAAFGFNFFSKGDVYDYHDGVRVMAWNVSGWDIHNWDKKNQQTYQPLMFDLIEQTSSDVLLLQEFFNCIDPDIVPSYVNMLAERGYPHYFFSPHSFTVSGKFQSGLAIFSRQPLSDTVFVFPESGGHSEGFQRADIELNGKMYRFFNTHLESPGMDSDDIDAVGKARGKRTLFYKLKNSHEIRMNQARELKAEMNRSPHPVVLGGDFGELPNSTTYFFLRKGMRDAFTKKGSGLGRTFGYISPTLRIDYLFADRSLKIAGFYKINKDYSAHYPIIADLSE